MRKGLKRKWLMVALVMPRKKGPQGYERASVEVGKAVEKTENRKVKTTHFGVNLEDNLEKATDEEESESTSDNNDFDVIT